MPPMCVPGRPHLGAAFAAWSLASVAVIALLTVAAVAVAYPPETGRLEALWVLSWLGLPVVGAVVVSRRPGNVVGWLLLGSGTGIAMGLVAGALQMFVTGPDGVSGPAGVAVLIVGTVGFNAGYGLIPLLLLYFPEGRLEESWRRLARLVVALLVLSALAWLLRETTTLESGTLVANPLAPPVLGPVAEAAIGPLIVALVLAALAAVARAVVRYRRARGLERLQRRWFVLSAAALPLLLGLGMVTSFIDQSVGQVVIYLGWIVGVNGLAIAIGIAVLRYRLYEIDRFVSRTVTYAVVTAVLLAVYAAIAVLPSAVFQLESDVLVAAATLAVAAVFVPLRRRVQARVDRRFNRSRYDAKRLVERFGAQVRHELGLEDLTSDLHSVVAATVQPAHLSLWLSVNGRMPASLPGPRADT